MNLSRTYLPLIPLLLFCGCKTVKLARQAQSETDRLPGETTVPAARAGIDQGQTYALATLEQIALRHHPSVLQARQAVEAARLQRKMTRSGRLPKVTASSAYNRSTQNSWGASTSEKMSGSWSGGIGLDLLLYDFGKLDAQEKQALESLIAAEEQSRQAELDVIYNVRSAFFERHRTDQLYEVARTNELQYAEHLKEAVIMNEVGTRRKYDVTKAEVDLGNARLEVVTASNDLVVAHAKLNRELGLSDHPGYTLDQARLAPREESVDALMATARENAPSLAVLRARERAASAYVDQTIADLYPDLSLSSDAKLSGRGFPLVWNFSWAANIAQTLFSGYKKTSAIEEAVTKLRAARSEIADAEQTLYLNLATTAAQRESARKSTDIAKMTLQRAKDNFDIVNEQYRVGISSSIERTDAQTAVTEAQAEVIRAYYDEQAAHARIAYLIGSPVATGDRPPRQQPEKPAQGNP